MKISSITKSFYGCKFIATLRQTIAQVKKLFYGHYLQIFPGEAALAVLGIGDKKEGLAAAGESGAKTHALVVGKVEGRSDYARNYLFL
jgi:hypothetical protein